MVFLFDLVPGYVRQPRKLDFCDVPQLAEIFSFASVPGVLVYRVGGGTGPFEELGGWEPIFIGRLVV